MIRIGFLHSAFTLRVEGRLEQSKHFNEYIPRGELVELLTKALLYTEVETHCKGDGLITDCKSSFSLLKRHQCAVDLMDDVVNGAAEKVGKLAVSNGVLEAPLKRKANLPADGDVQNRRVKRSLEPESAETNNGLSRDCTFHLHTFSLSFLFPSLTIFVNLILKLFMLVAPVSVQNDQSATPSLDRDASPMSVETGIMQVNGNIMKPKPGDPYGSGPGDKRTSPNAIIILEGHEHEVSDCSQC